MTNRNPRVFLLPFGLIWSTVVCGFLAVVCYDTFNQLRAMSFASTEGVVDSSYLKIPPWGTRSGGSYDAQIAYHYSVAGRQYSGNRVRYLALISQGWATDTVRRFAVGTRPTVFYNPSNPAETMLIRGLQGDDLLMALFLMPFAMIMLAIWLFLASPEWARFSGFRILNEGMVARVRPSPWHAVVAAVAGLGISPLPLCLIVEIPISHPSLAVAALAWGAVLTIAVVAGTVKLSSIRSGSQDIVLDLSAKTLNPPDRAAIPFRDIQILSLKARHELWIGFSKGSQRMELPNGLQDEAEVRRLAEYIAQKVGVSLKAKL